MKCDNRGCDGNVHLTTFAGDNATECKKCNYIQLIPDNMIEYVKKMVEDVRPVIGVARTKTKMREYKVTSDLENHYVHMKNFDDILKKNRNYR